MACPRCGSWSVRADRSLGGRMVCGRCGTPLQGVKQGVKGVKGGPAGKRLLPALPKQGRWRWWLLALVALGAALASLDSGSRQPGGAPENRDASFITSSIATFTNTSNGGIGHAGTPSRSSM